MNHCPKRADTVVISSAIAESNVELAAAREAGCLVLHRAQGLAATMTDSRPAAVAGANGKTTTTSMLTVALQAAISRAIQSDSSPRRITTG